MAGGDYSGIDFTSDFESKAGPFTSELLGADFRNAKLAGCNLSRADLASANLRGTDLRGANLEGANLYTALLEDSNLEGANLRGANLISAEMQGVRLSDADLEGGRFGQTSIGGVDLSGTLHSGLATHFRPFVRESSVDCGGLDFAARAYAPEWSFAFWRIPVLMKSFCPWCEHGLGSRSSFTRCFSVTRRWIRHSPADCIRICGTSE
jgi:uncharacterized protein YjbI with pentapeptide repeats